MHIFIRTRLSLSLCRADAAENRAAKAEHTIAEMAEDARRAEVARAQMAVDAAALSGERDQLQARLADVDKALIRARDEGEAAAAKAALGTIGRRDVQSKPMSRR